MEQPLAGQTRTLNTDSQRHRPRRGLSNPRSQASEEGGRAVDAPAVGGWWSPPHTATREPTEYHHRTRRRSLHLEASLRLLHIHHPRYEAQNTAAEDGERRLREKLAAC